MHHTTPPLLKIGDTIGICCPSQLYSAEKYDRDTAVLRRLGFNVKLSPNIARDTYGYAASAKERADDFNVFAADSTVKMVLFGGGGSGVELLPHLDFGVIAKNPKIYCSYSDGTTVLNAISAMSGLVTYYGQSPGVFFDLRQYDYEQFCDNFLTGHTACEFKSDGAWRVLRGGCCEGRLVGGYSALFALMLGSRYFSYDKGEKHLLFIEDYSHFSTVAEVATYLAFIEQSEFMKSVTGLIFGHYDENVPDELLSLLRRFGARAGIPVVYTDDFGHGARHAILPIGARARLDDGVLRLEV